MCERERKMEKKRIYIEKCGPEDHMFKEERHHHRHHDEGRKHKRIHVHGSGMGMMKMTTKLVTTKEELVSYVNELGEKGHKIDVFKIEDGLYKVVVLERQDPDKKCCEDTEPKKGCCEDTESTKGCCEEELEVEIEVE